jgi:hypothetical protein
MRDPLDHDGDGRKGGSLPRRGRPPKAVAQGALTVKKAEAVFDGQGGFLPVGAKFDAVDDNAAAALIAKGFAE